MAQRGLGHGVGRGHVVVFLLADRLAGQQALEAGFLARRLVGLGASLGEGVLVGRAVNLEHRLSGLDRDAFLIQAFDQNAADPGSNLGFLGPFRLGHDLDRRRQVDGLDFDDADRHGAWFRGLWRIAVGAGSKGNHDGNEQRGDGKAPWLAKGWHR